MSVPPFQELMLPCLRQHLSGPKKVPDMIASLAVELNLSDEDVEERLSSGHQTKLSNRLHWARIYMTRAGLLRRLERGLYALTERGQSVIDDGVQEISTTYLERYPEFREFRSKRTAQDVSGVQETSSDDGGQTETPQELIAQASRQLDEALAKELLDAILDLTPLQFEQVIIDLLSKLGYGGGDPARGRRMGRSGDGGIDGIVNEDALGLDAVYMQAKRYDPSNTVGRPALQAFIGSLTGEGATKGVFVTTSSFTKDAVAYVDRVAHRVVLIDGATLADLMVRSGVGVRVESVFTIKSIDNDYFDPD